MDASVVHNIRLHHLVTVGFQDAGERITEKVVAHMPEMQRLVGVRRRIFHHHEVGIFVGGSDSEFFICGNAMKHAKPERRVNSDVEETLHYIEFLNSSFVLHKPFTYLCGSCLRSLSRSLKKWEHHHLSDSPQIPSLWPAARLSLDSPLRHRAP